VFTIFIVKLNYYLSDYKLSFTLGSFEFYQKILKKIYEKILIFGASDYTHTIFLQLQMFSYYKGENEKEKNFTNVSDLFNDVQKYFNEEAGEIYLSVLARSMTKEDRINKIFDFLNNKFKISNDYLQNNKYFNEKFNIQTSHNRMLSNQNNNDKKIIEKYQKFFELKLKNLKANNLENYFYKSKKTLKKVLKNDKINFKKTLFFRKDEEFLIEKLEKVFKNNKNYFENEN
jgi:hypothetical protein